MVIFVGCLRSAPAQRVKVLAQLCAAAYLKFAGFALAISHPLGLRWHLVALGFASRLGPALALLVPGFTAGCAELLLYVGRVQ